MFSKLEQHRAKRILKQSHKSNRNNTKKIDVDNNLDRREARTPRNESMECSTDRTT